MIDDLEEDTEQLCTAVQLLARGTVTDESMNILYHHFHALEDQHREAVLNLTCWYLIQHTDPQGACNWIGLQTILDALYNIMDDFDEDSITHTFGNLVPCLFSIIVCSEDDTIITKSATIVAKIVRHLQYFREEWYPGLVAAAEVVTLHGIFCEILRLDTTPCPEICHMILMTASETLMQEKSELTWVAIEIVNKLITKGIEFDYNPILQRITEFLDEADETVMMGILPIYQTLKYFHVGLIVNTMRIIHENSEFGDQTKDIMLFSRFTTYVVTFRTEVQSDPDLVQMTITLANQYINHDRYDLKMVSSGLLFSILPEFPDYDENLCRILLENFHLDLITRRVFFILIHWIEKASEPIIVSLTGLIGQYLDPIRDFLEGQDTPDAIILTGYLNIFSRIMFD